jgi:SPP1 gp7 family putative phage head morphogenesis protein
VTQRELNEIFESVYYGVITLDNLPDELYIHYAADLQKAVNKGFGSSLKKLTVASPEWDMLNHFRENVNVFSGAKTFQQIRDSQNFILDAKGQLRPFNDYLKDVKKIDALYREAWLRVERDTTISQAQGARKWLDIESKKDVLPFLVFKTQGDARVREDHAALDGFTARVDDPVWNSLAVPLDWNCRCNIEQVSEATPDTKEQIQNRIIEHNKNKKPGDKIKSLNQIPDKLFRMNPAKDKIIFKNEGVGSHPYFKVGESYEVLKTNNFGLDINYMID